MKRPQHGKWAKRKARRYHRTMRRIFGLTAETVKPLIAPTWSIMEEIHKKLEQQVGDFR